MHIYKYGAVLGNGPSHVNYDGEADILIGCNVPPRQVDATIVTDIEVVRALHEGRIELPYPLIVSSQAFEKMKELTLESRHGIISVFRTRDWYSSAHYAAQHLIMIGCKKISIWGCDSIFTDEVSSLTDRIVVPKPTPFVKQWRRCWTEMETNSTEVDFVFHKPSLQ